MKEATSDAGRHLGLTGATLVGVGAIVGGGILALAGVAFQTAGPAAILAFAANGVIALITALSFAELASRFPQNGGTYSYARKVYPVETAFTVGWVVWFASMVAAVLYALGFGAFAVLLLEQIWGLFGEPPAWASSQLAVRVLAVAATLTYTWSLTRQSDGGGQFATVGKVALFGVLILAGFWALSRAPAGTVQAGISPFLPTGPKGLLAAMGYTFIALQGFDLIAAVGGEVKQPTKTIPRAMFLSLIIALVVYLPLLFLVSTVGIAPGESIQALGQAHPETIVAVAAERIMGGAGFWLVMVAAVLAMLSALQANLLAASRVALAMARDETLPKRLGTVHPVRGTPATAVLSSALPILLMLLVIPDIAAAGAVSSLIFLVSFALTHWTCFLARRRSSLTHNLFISPWFPLFPLLGLTCCLALAIFQGVVVPSAGSLALAWIGLGGLLYLFLFSQRARIKDARSEALDPELVQLRGRTPLVLVPVANPDNAAAMVTVAAAMTPPRVGRVLLLSVVQPPAAVDPEEAPTQLDDAQAVLRQALITSFTSGAAPEALTTIAANPWHEIARVSRIHRCESLLLGFSKLSEEKIGTELEELVSRVDCDVAILRSPPDWKLNDVRRVLVPLGGRSSHDALRARILGSLSRASSCEIVFLRVFGQSVPEAVCEKALRSIRHFLEDELPVPFTVKGVRSDHVTEPILEEAKTSDLILLGLQRHARYNKVFGHITLQIARDTESAIMMISRRG